MKRVSRYLYRADSGVLYFRRRVPLDYRAIDPRTYVRKTTRCRDVHAGMTVADRMNAELERFWAAGGRQSTADGEADLCRHDAALKRARALGVSYKPIEDIAAGSLPDIVRRIEALESRGLGKSRDAVEAALGSDKGEGVPLSNLLK